ncbi:MAG: N-acetylmuramoyl-L-alanine amidase [Anaerolineales bacterium]|nr:N-acetylmuramoyl-L-alanine amidase [Anaerolineales bacterium]
MFLADSQALWDNAGGRISMDHQMTLPLDRCSFLKLLAASGAAAYVAMLHGCSRRPAMESLPIISRAEWGALEINLETSVEGNYDPVTNPEGMYVYQEPLDQVLNTIVAHHSALPVSDGPLEIQHLHMERKGYADIGYHYVIDEKGGIYEGRSLMVRGAHTGGHNTGTVGIVLMGNFQEIEPTQAQIISLKELARRLVSDYKITHLAGHRDFQPGVTVCPGDNLERLLPDIAAVLGLKFGTDGYVGPSVYNDES